MCKNLIRIVFYFTATFFSLMLSNAFAKGTNDLIDVRVWSSKDSIRTTLETSKEIRFKYDKTKKSLTIKIEDSLKIEKYASKFKNAFNNSDYLTNIAYDTKNKTLIYKFKNDVDINVFNIEPIQKYKHRLVVDIKSINKQKLAQEKKKNYFVVAIDAGHGGEDPGAIGEMGTYEKDIT